MVWARGFTEPNSIDLRLQLNSHTFPYKQSTTSAGCSPSGMTYTKPYVFTTGGVEQFPSYNPDGNNTIVISGALRPSPIPGKEADNLLIEKVRVRVIYQRPWTP